MITRFTLKYESDMSFIMQVENGVGRLHLAMFTRERHDEIITFIQEHCDVSYDDGKVTTVYATGFGSHKWCKMLEEKLRIKYVT